MKLIILNGPAGVGKSTLARRLHEDAPMSLLLNIDNWRKQISHWRENRRESQVLSYKTATVAIGAHLEESYDVIVDKAILNDDSTLDALVGVGRKHNAQIYELVLTAEKEVIARRAFERGFDPNGLLNAEMVEKLLELSQELQKTRPEARVIDTTHLTPDEVYEIVREIIQ